LATKSYASHSASSQNIFFGFGHLFGFSRNKLNSAGCATRFSAASVQLIGTCFVSQGSDESLSTGNFERSNSFNG
jgi:hypothetical protein